MQRRTLYLASESPRRLALLRECGFAPTVIPTGVDDGPLQSGDVHPAAWTSSLAYLKAKAGYDALMTSDPARAESGIVLGADTVVVKGAHLIGKPTDREHAEAILRQLEAGSHQVVTGVAILVDGQRQLIVDSSEVEVGTLGDDRIREYLETDQWIGKAGAYNLAERVESGWPITYHGDPTTVMGLPMMRLTPLLRSLLHTESPQTCGS